jgi:hypothetical protein
MARLSAAATGAADPGRAPGHGAWEQFGARPRPGTATGRQAAQGRSKHIMMWGRGQRPVWVLLGCALVLPAAVLSDAAAAGGNEEHPAGLVAQACTFKGKPVQPQRCSGLRYCEAYNGKYGPQSDLLDCKSVEAQAVGAVNGLFDGVEDSSQVHSACWVALVALHCARVFGQLSCEDGAKLGLGAKPCSSACERIVADCAEHVTASSSGFALKCTADEGYDTDPANCATLPKQDQLVLAAQHSLSPMAADLVGLWSSDEEKYDDVFLSATHRTSRSEMKGWSFYTNGPRWFDPAWFGLEGGTAIQRQYSQLQAAEHVLRVRIDRRKKETGEEPDPMILNQLTGDAKDAGAIAEDAPLFGWMEAGTCACVFLAYRFQNQVAEQERREAEEAAAKGVTIDGRTLDGSDPDLDDGEGETTQSARADRAKEGAQRKTD